MLKLSLAPLLALSLIACGGEAPAKATSADVTVSAPPEPAPSAERPAATASATTSAPAPVASASASAAPAEEEKNLSTADGYPKELSARIFDLYKPKPKCETGWTGSVEIEMKDGKITFWEISGESPDPKMVGKTVPKPPKELESFFSHRVMVGICAGYIARQ